MRFLKYLAKSLPAVLLFAALGAAVAWSGVIDVSARNAARSHGLTDRFLATAARRSVAFHAERVAHAATREESGVEAGLAHYAASCIHCHAAPGVPASEFSLGLHPPAPDLSAPSTQELSDSELLWVVSNGISLSGMPSFAVSHGTQELRQIVDFVRELPRLSPEHKARLAAGRDASHAGGEPADHGRAAEQRPVERGYGGADPRPPEEASEPGEAPPQPVPSPQESADAYTCPMHPGVVQSQPGQCPLCGMQLVVRQP